MPTDVQPWAREIVGISSSQTIGDCVGCGKPTRYARHPAGDFFAMVPACDKHTDKADALLRDPANWSTR